MKKFFLLFLSLFVFTNVKANELTNCTNNTMYIDYTNVYETLGNDNNLKQFYTDFKDWFDNQSEYQYYFMVAQGGSDNLIHYYVSVFNDTSYYDLLAHNYSTRYSNFNIGVFSSANVIRNVKTLSTTDLIFDENNFLNGVMLSSSFSKDKNSLPFESGTLHFTFNWLYSNSSTYTNGTIIFIDNNNSFTLASTSDFINLKIDDDYYCSSDNFPTLNSIYPLYISNTPTSINEDLTYLPINDFTSYDTYIYLDKNTIRAIKDNICTDFDLSNHYNKIISSCENFDSSNYVIIEQQNLTNDFLFRLDISSFIILLFFMFIIVVFIPYYVFSSFFRKRRF